MKILFISVRILTVLFLFTASVKAQNKDYVITANGDTLACTITSGFVQKYKAASMVKAKPILMSEIKEYYISKDSTLFRREYIRPGKRGSAQYMKVLENGKINLYEDMYNTSTIWYVSKGSDTLRAIKNVDFNVSTLFFKSRKSRENEFAGMIADNKVVYDKYLADDKFSYNEIRNLIHLYNTGEPFKEKPDTRKVRIGNRP